MEEEENIRVRQDTALTRMSELSSQSDESHGFDEDLYKLLKAAKDGELELIKSTIQIDRRFLNEFGDSGWALVHYAVFYNHKNILQYLI